MDLGLPSGTLWLDRLVGATAPSDPGLYYQWGAINGHTQTDGYNFSNETYIQQGLNQISSNLSETEDAARAFYGNDAKMPSLEQAQELIEFTTAETIRNNVIRLTSVINGASIILYKGGVMSNSSITAAGKLRVWLSTYFDDNTAYSLHGEDVVLSISNSNNRYSGLNIMAVHS